MLANTSFQPGASLLMHAPWLAIHHSSHVATKSVLTIPVSQTHRPQRLQGKGNRVALPDIHLGERLEWVHRRALRTSARIWQHILEKKGSEDLASQLSGLAVCRNADDAADLCRSDFMVHPKAACAMQDWWKLSGLAPYWQTGTLNEESLP